MKHAYKMRGSALPEANALRSRGCPNPDRAYVGTRKRDDLRREREQAAHLARLQAAQVAMLEAQRAVRAAKARGADFAALATVARARRADYLRLQGGVESRQYAVADNSSSNKVKAVD